MTRRCHAPANALSSAAASSSATAHMEEASLARTHVGTGAGGQRIARDRCRANEIPSRACRPRRAPAAETTVAPPADAPADLKVSGKFTAADGRRVDSDRRDRRHLVPVRQGGAAKDRLQECRCEGQPVQGFSGIKTCRRRHLLGADRQRLRLQGQLSRRHADVPQGQARLGHRQGRDASRPPSCHDPDTQGALPHHQRGHRQALPDRRRFRHRVRSSRSAAEIWFGDEFGPYLLKTDIAGQGAGRVRDHGRRQAGALARPLRTSATPAVPAGAVAFNVRRSRGYEGMAASKDGKHLYPLLEGPMWDADKKDWEKVDGKEVLRILEFSVADGKWTGRHWKYPLELAGNNIGDFNMIDATTGLDHRARQRRRDRRQGLPRGQAGGRLLQRAGQVQARLQDRDDRCQRRRSRAQDRLHRPDGHRRPEEARQAGRQGRQARPFRSSPSRMSTSSTRRRSSSPTTTTSPTRPAASRRSRTTTSSSCSTWPIF